jgi:UDP-N-acetyl-D-mannosaminuronate dehydrogenase
MKLSEKLGISGYIGLWLATAAARAGTHRMGTERARSVHLGGKILLLGVAVKTDVGDARNAPTERIIELLLDNG